MTKIRPWRLVILGVLTLGVTAVAQSQAPTFKSGVALVTVDVAVFDKDGRPVPNLGAEAFEVKLNGRVQPVRVVSYLEARGELTPQTGAPVAPAPPPWDGRAGRQMISNTGVIDPATPAGEDRVFVILVDDLSIPPTRGQRLLNAAQQFVSRLPASDPVGLVRSSNSQDALNPTLNRAVIIDAIKKTSGSLGELTALRPQGSGGENAGPDGFVGVSQALDIDSGLVEALKLAIARACFGGDRTAVDAQVLDVLIAVNQCAGEVRQQARQTAAMAKRLTTLQIDGFEAAIRAMGQADGIRHLVIVSDGLAIGREPQQLNRLAAAAARAGVQVSVLMEEHDMSLVDEGRREVGGTPQVDLGAPQRRIEDQRMFMDGLQTATKLVGGQFYRIVGDPLPFYERVRSASAAVYRLGVEPPAGLQPGRTMTVEAMVKHPGASTFVNRLAMLPDLVPSAAPAAKTVDERLKDAIASGQEHGSVPLQVATLLRRTPGASGGLELTINLAVPPASSGPVRGPVTAMFGLAAAGAAAGTALNSGRRVIEAPAPDGVFQTTFGVPVGASGAYKLRIAVADAEGALGAIETDLDATLPTMGPFAASDLLVAWVDASGQGQLMALDPLPARATGVRAELELYPPASGVALPDMNDVNDVQVEISLTKDGEADPLDDRLITPSDTNGVWRAATEFSADDLAPGRYTLRARVHVGDKGVVGSAIATFVK